MSYGKTKRVHWFGFTHVKKEFSSIDLYLFNNYKIIQILALLTKTK